MNIIKAIWHFILWLFQITRFYRHRNRNRPLILAFGGVIPSGIDDSLFNSDGRLISEKKFRKLLRYLMKIYFPVSVGSILSGFRGESFLYPHSFALTFDYGYNSIQSIVLPLLEEHSISFAVAIPTDNIECGTPGWIDRIEYAISKSRAGEIKIRMGENSVSEQISSPAFHNKVIYRLINICIDLDHEKREMFIKEIERQTESSLAESSIPEHLRLITAGNLRRLAESGVQVGSMTASQVNLTRVSIRSLREEILDSKQKVEKLTGKPCDFLTYPFGNHGSFNDETIGLLERCCYQYALTKINGFVDFSDNPFSLPRVTVSGNDSFYTAIARIAGIGIKKGLKRKTCT